MARIAIFRAPFKHDALKAIGVKDGIADAAFLATAAANTNRLIRDHLHAPPMKEGHDSPDQKARGWISGVTTDGTTLFADVELTPHGKQQVSDRELRWISASFRTGFKLTGAADSEVLPGPWLDHAAMLGSSHPAVKGLVDLSAIEFSEDDANESPLPAWVQFDESNNAITYFAELSGNGDREEDMAVENEARFAAIEAKLTEQTATITQLKTEKADAEARFAEADAKAKTAEAKLQDVETAQKAAKFAEWETSTAARIRKAQEEKKLGAERAAQLLAKAKTVFGNADRQADFSELLDSLAPIVPTKPLGEGDGGGEDGRGEYGASSADFAELAKPLPDPNALMRVHAATGAYMAEKPGVDYVKAQAAVKAAASRHAN